MTPQTTTRVAENTADEINQQIQRYTEKNLACATAGGRAGIERRLAELDREWDIERFLELNAATVSLLGWTLGATRNRLWFLLPAIVAGFLAQHAVQGWCPPIPVLRRFGFRTAVEIDQERYALKAIRGDFRGLSTLDETPHPEVAQAFQAAFP